MTGCPWSGFRGRHDKAAGRRAAAAEKEFFHFLLEELARLRVDRREPVLVDEDGLVFQPQLPGLLRDLIEDALAQLTRVGRLVQPLRCAPEFDALYGSAHDVLSAVASVKTA